MEGIIGYEIYAVYEVTSISDDTLLFVVNLTITA